MSRYTSSISIDGIPSKPSFTWPEEIPRATARKSPWRSWLLPLLDGLARIRQQHLDKTYLQLSHTRPSPDFTLRPNVNLGNIKPNDILGLEAMRSGLRLETFRHFAPSQVEMLALPLSVAYAG